MKNLETGDQSGGIDRRDGASTPAHHRGHNAGDRSSREVAKSTDKKNPGGAFQQTSREVSEEVDEASSQNW